MLRLETFGCLSLMEDGELVAVAQGKRLALLAMLAAAGDRGLSRDKVLGYLWPESSAESARHSLEQVLYELRRKLGASAFKGTNPLRLDFDVLSSDVRDFERALESRELEKATKLYRGPFLDGFFLTDTSEFERWADAERRRLAALHASALETLAATARERGELQQAAGWWRERAAADPLSARGALGLMRALAEAGDRQAALQHARVYESLLAEALDSKPDPDITEFVAQLRSGAPFEVAPQRRPPEPRPQAVSPVSPTPAPSPGAKVPLEATKPIGGAQRLARRPIIAMGVAAGVALIIAVALSSGVARTSRSFAGDSRVAVDAKRIAVLPFRVIGDSSLAYLEEGLVDLLAARLAGEGELIAVEPRTALSAWRRSERAPSGDAPGGAAIQVARELGAGEVAVGELLVDANRQLALSGRVLGTTNGQLLASATVNGPVDSLLPLVDQLVVRLLALRADEAPRSMNAVITPSLPALRAFLSGRAAYRFGHTDEARRHFSRALEHDSTFALAALDLALAMGSVFRWTAFTTDTIQHMRATGIGTGGVRLGGDDAQWARAIEIAWQGRDRLSHRDRALLVALRGDYPRTDLARQTLANWQRAVQAAPDRAEGHYWLGHILLYQGFAMGFADSRGRAAASFRRARELDSGFVPALGGLLEIAAFERDISALRRLRALYLAGDSLSDQAQYVRWRVATVSGDREAARATRAGFESLGTGTLDRIQWTSQVEGVALDDAELAMAAILRRASDAVQRQVAFHKAKFLALNRGRPREALGILAAKRELEPNADLYRGFAVRDALFWEADSTAGARAAGALEVSLAQRRAETGAMGRDSPRAAQWRLSAALWHVWREDTTGVADHIAQLLRATGPTRVGQAQLLDALLAAQTRRPDAPAALARLDSLALQGCCDLPHFINLVSARLHERAGDLPAALAAVRRGRWFYPPEHLSTYLREEGRLAALTGDRTGAIRAYRHYLALRSAPEPSLAVPVEAVRRELARLEGRR